MVRWLSIRQCTLSGKDASGFPMLLNCDAVGLVCMAFLTHIIYIALKVVMTNTPQCWELVGNDFKYKLNIGEMSQAHQLGAAFARHNFTTAACTARQGNAELGAPIYVSVNKDTFDHMLEYVRGHDTEPTIAGVDPLSVQRQQQAWRMMFPDVTDKFPVTAELTRVAKRAKKTHGPFLLVKVVSPLCLLYTSPSPRD